MTEVISFFLGIITGVGLTFVFKIVFKKKTSTQNNNILNNSIQGMGNIEIKK